MSISRQDLPAQIGHCRIGPRIVLGNSIAVLSSEQLMEFWSRLVNSGKRFLWVLRPEIVPENDRGHDDVPVELMEGKKKRRVHSGLGSTRGGLGPLGYWWVLDPLWM
ncbi:7-deoxyloganetic acid glucosyltransferase-like [Gossypium australe]|uniref:7-deoxyloganetic acid glucosyltransferase-like n=1 Tax=Gossypium australe TaxID=47621 RepID=A0A5B6WKJ1_9ROSI|nr:7-deoxyloganetic acid glucosyltransferase-like [Gossypium australe]